MPALRFARHWSAAAASTGCTSGNADSFMSACTDVPMHPMQMPPQTLACAYCASLCGSFLLLDGALHCKTLSSIRDYSTLWHVSTVGVSGSNTDSIAADSQEHMRHVAHVQFLTPDGAALMFGMGFPIHQILAGYRL